MNWRKEKELCPNLILENLLKGLVFIDCLGMTALVLAVSGKGQEKELCFLVKCHTLNALGRDIQNCNVNIDSFVEVSISNAEVI